jgi:hypothetical protein
MGDVENIARVLPLAEISSGPFARLLNTAAMLLKLGMPTLVRPRRFSQTLVYSSGVTQTGCGFLRMMTISQRPLSAPTITASPLGTARLYRGKDPLDRFLAQKQFERLIDLIRPKFPDIILPLPMS